MPYRTPPKRERLNLWQRVLRWLQLKHRSRLTIAIIMLGLDLAALGAVHSGIADEAVEGIKGKVTWVLYALLPLLGIGTADSGIVEAARRDPMRAAIPDDVRASDEDESEEESGDA